MVVQRSAVPRAVPGPRCPADRTAARYRVLVTSPERPPSVRPVEYKGEPLDSERGPGLGCFRFQLILLAVLIIITPVSVMAWRWDPLWSGLLLGATILMLLLTGQTIIFLLRLVATDRREGRRRPLASTTRTVGELEDEAGVEAAPGPATPGEPGAPPATPVADPRGAPDGNPGSSQETMDGDEPPGRPGVRE
jgi:hypothetical protein